MSWLRFQLFVLQAHRQTNNFYSILHWLDEFCTLTASVNFHTISNESDDPVTPVIAFIRIFKELCESQELCEFFAFKMLHRPSSYYSLFTSYAQSSALRAGALFGLNIRNTIFNINSNNTATTTNHIIKCLNGINKNHDNGYDYTSPFLSVL